MFVNATKEGIVFEEQQEGVQRRTGEWYLKDSRDGSGKTVTEAVSYTHLLLPEALRKEEEIQILLY